ncbi:hypothetical protein EMIT0P260_10152 [Pseudomonas sp. IT-P260]
MADACIGYAAHGYHTLRLGYMHTVQAVQQELFR